MQTKWNLSEYENPKRYDIENKSFSDFPFLLSWAQKLNIQNEWILDINRESHYSFYRKRVSNDWYRYT
ncbi:hypothetical protein ABH946_001871 [Bacillus sp. RC145]